MYKGIVQRKSRTSFNFKYVPNESKKTGREAYHPGKNEQGIHSTQGTYIGLFEVFFLGVLVFSGGIVILGILGTYLRMTGRVTGILGFA